MLQEVERRRAAEASLELEVQRIANMQEQMKGHRATSRQTLDEVQDGMEALAREVRWRK